jgi:hypothetical protein
MIRELGREDFLVSACFSPVAFSPPFCLFDPSDWLFSSLWPEIEKNTELFNFYMTDGQSKTVQFGGKQVDQTFSINQ